MKLNIRQVALLREVVERRRPDLAELIGAAEDNRLSRPERLQLCELISAEFAECGVDRDSEPTPRGLKLEELLDVLNRPNIQR